MPAAPAPSSCDIENVSRRCHVSPGGTSCLRLRPLINTNRTSPDFYYWIQQAKLLYRIPLKVSKHAPRVLCCASMEWTRAPPGPVPSVAHAWSSTRPFIYRRETEALLRVQTKRAAERHLHLKEHPEPWCLLSSPQSTCNRCHHPASCP